MAPMKRASLGFSAVLALILATRSIDRMQKIRSLIVGLSVLCAAHFLFRLHHALFINLHISTMYITFCMWRRRLRGRRLRRMRWLKNELGAAASLRAI